MSRSGAATCLACTSRCRGAGSSVPLLVKDMPKEKHRDLDFIVEQLDWEANVDPHFKQNHYLEPIVAAGSSREGSSTSGSSTERCAASSFSPRN